MKGIQIKIPETENLSSPFQGQLSMLTKIVELQTSQISKI